jgi:hypothetical protein
MMYCAAGQLENGLNCRIVPAASIDSEYELNALTLYNCTRVPESNMRDQWEGRDEHFQACSINRHYMADNISADMCMHSL